MNDTLGDRVVAKRFFDRSKQWHKLFDPDLGYIRRDEKGSFLKGFTPENYDGFVEGNSAQYTWMVPFDLKGVIEAIGGPETVNARLDS